MSAREELHKLVDELADTELEAARDLLQDLRGPSSHDESLTNEELAELDAGQEAVRRGDYITMEEYKRQRGL